MKRSFSLSELQQAIQTTEFASPLSAAAAAPNDPSYAQLGKPAMSLSTMRRSKSMDALNEFGEPGPLSQVLRAESVMLPSLSSLGLSFAAQQHGYEELKRGRGLHGKMPTSSSNSSLVGMVEEGGQDDETRGAASALMELFAQPSVTSPASAANPLIPKPEHLSKTTEIPSFAPPMTLPPLRELLAQSHPGNAGAVSALPATQKTSGEASPSQTHAAILQPEQRPAERPAPPIKIEETGGSPSAPQGGNAAGSPTPQPEGLDLGSPGGASGGDDAKHNKYCHFCQHVKVKRATSMLACENTECARRFCEHCLVTHLLHVVPADGRGLQEPLDGKWLCPICRKVCCCAIQSCSRAHRHCKAYRYRQRRAEQAARRSLAAAASDAAPQAPGFPAHHLHSSPGPVAHGPGHAGPGQSMLGGPGNQRPGGVGMGGMPVMRPGPGMPMMAHQFQVAMPPGADLSGMGMGMMMGVGRGYMSQGQHQQQQQQQQQQLQQQLQHQLQHQHQQAVFARNM